MVIIDSLGDKSAKNDQFGTKLGLSRDHAQIFKTLIQNKGSLLHKVAARPAAPELYLKVVFKGKGGVSTGRLLAAVNRPH